MNDFCVGYIVSRVALAYVQRPPPLSLLPVFFDFPYEPEKPIQVEGVGHGMIDPDDSKQPVCGEHLCDKDVLHRCE